MLHLLSLLITILWPLIFTLTWVATFFSPKIKKGFALRLKSPWEKGLANSPKPHEPATIWFHVSSGEFEYAKTVITELKKRGHKIVVSYFSPSVEKSIAEFKDVDAFFPSPWENYFAWRNFFKFHSPKVLAIARTDLWPVMIWQTKRRKIPVVLFSASLSHEKLQKKTFIGKWWLKILFKQLDGIYCATETDKKELEALAPAQKVANLGDTRFDQVKTRILQNSQISVDTNRWKNNSNTLVIGSSWSEDEEVILPTLQRFVQSRIKIIFVPHEPTPEHISSLTDFFKANSLTYALFSEGQPDIGASILLVDRVGVLAEIYKFADAAFVGGGFKKSVHSVMEPLACGLFTVFGPQYQNNREAIESVQLQLTKSVSSSEEFQKTLFEHFVKNPSQRDVHKKRILMYVEGKLGASLRVAKEIQAWTSANRNS